MKKGIFAVLAICTIFATVFTMAACSSGGGGGGSSNYTVKFSPGTAGTNATNMPAQTTIAKTNTGLGDKLLTPVWTGHQFTGWYDLAASPIEEYQSDTPIVKNVTLTAQWDGGSGAPIKIEFDVNTPEGYSGTPIDPILPVTIPSGTNVGVDWPVDPAADGYVFIEWQNAAGDVVHRGTVLTVATTLYAQWVELGANQIVITFKYNYGANAEDADKEPNDTFRVVTDGQAIGAANWPADPVRDGYTFIAWKGTEGGTGDTYTSASTTWPTGAANTGTTLNTVYAAWEKIGGPVIEEPPAGTDLTGAEKVTLGNQALVVYAFILPAGKKYSDYKEITAQFMFGPSQFTKAPNHMRLLGNYKVSDFSFGTVQAGPNNGKKLAIAGYQSSGTSETNKFAPFIIINSLIANNSSTTLAAALEGIGMSAEPWTWSTRSYNIINGEAHSSFDEANRPVGTATGPFYFGIGFPGDGANGITQYIKDVTLVGYSAADSVKAVPAWFTNDIDGSGDVNYPVFTGWATWSTGDNGIQHAARAMADGTTTTPIKVQAAVTFNLNYTGAPAAQVIKVMKGNAIGDNWPAVPTSATAGTFVAWNTAANGSGTTATSATVFDADTTLYAQWAAPITITLDPAGGNWAGSSANKTVSIGTGGSLSEAQLTPPVKDGYRFDKWIKSDGTAVTAQVTTFSAAATITAQWIETPAITFDMNFVGGPANIVKKPDIGTAIADFPTGITYGFYEVASWNTRKDGKGTTVGATTKWNATATVYAQWKALRPAPGDVVYLSTNTEIGTASTIRTPLTANMNTNYATNSQLQWTVASMNLPAGYTLASYDSYTVKVKVYNSDGEEIDQSTLAANTNVVQFKFSRSASSMGDGDVPNDCVMYNLGGHPPENDRVYGTKEAMPASILNGSSTILGMFVQGGGNLQANNVGKVEVVEIIFHSPGTGTTSVNIDGIEDPIFGSASIYDQTWNVSKGDLQISLPGYDIYRWIVDGVQQSSKTDTLTLTVGNYQNKINTNVTVTAIVQKDDVSFSKTIVVAVKR